MVWTEAEVEVDNIVCAKGYKKDGKRIKAHWFILPTPPAKAIGVCKNCGYERDMFNRPDQSGYGFNK